MRLKDKVSIITGGGSGIGQASAIRMAAEGAKVVIWDINMEGAAETEKTIKAAGGTAKVMNVDVMNWDKSHAAADEVVKEFGRIDVLVACVGGGKFNPWPTMTSDFWDKEIAFNLKTAVNCAHAVTGPMMKQKSGIIILFTSGKGYMGHPNLSGYGAGKAGVVSLMESLAAELATHQIHVNVIGPGLTDTPLTRNQFEAWGDAGKQMYDNLKKKCAFGRVGEADDIAKVVVFLASDDAHWVHGQNILVGGAMV